MAEPVSPADSYAQSQEILRDLYGNSPITRTNLFEESRAETQETDVETMGDQTVAAGNQANGASLFADMPHAATQDSTIDERPTRLRFSYRNRRIVADYRSFIKDECVDEWRVHAGAAWTIIKCRGKIVACANKNNNNHYRVEWDHDDIQGMDSNWVAYDIPASKKNILRAAAELYDFSATAPHNVFVTDGFRNRHGNGLSGLAPRATPGLGHSDGVAGVAGVANAAEASETAVDQEQRLPVTTPHPLSAERRQLAANLLTCGRSFSSSISSVTNPSLLNSGDSARNAYTTTNIGVRTRASSVLVAEKDLGAESESNSEGEEAPEDDDDAVAAADDSDCEDDCAVCDNVCRPCTDIPESRRTLYETVKSLSWKFAPIISGNGPKALNPRNSWYDGPDGLRPGIAQQFTDPFECFTLVSGLGLESVARLAQNTNCYFHEHIKPRINNRNNRYHSIAWKDVSVEEMYRFLGIMLKMSLQPIDGGGYAAYFRSSNVSINPGGNATPKVIDGTARSLSHYMSLNRFRQIRGAFHPENKRAAGGGDKCYQVRHAINSFNTSSMMCFETPCNCAFDEGGVGCRSRFCPCRQYNKDKPEKYRVDFFVLSCSKRYTILHLDVYQGKNSNNVGINEQLKDFPVTQKAVLNALWQRGLHLETSGYRFLAADNRYACPELAVACRDKFNTYMSGTCRANRVGWEKEGMDLKKTSERGSSKMMYDSANEILIGQWRDNKVVQFVSSTNEGGLGKVKRQIGSQKVDFDCPNALIQYQKNMFGVDKGDQMRTHGAGFSNKVHFKKWYKRVYLAILDCGLLNTLVAWNLSAEDHTLRSRKTLRRHELYAYIAQSLCDYVDPKKAEEEAEAERAKILCLMEGHRPEKAKAGTRCGVCALEYQWTFRAGDDNWSGLKADVGRCTQCSVPAHMFQPTRKTELHNQPEFENMTCFEIIHTPIGREIFQRQSVGEEGGRSSYKVNDKHPTIIRVKEKLGVPLTRKRKASVLIDKSDDADKRQKDNGV